MLRINTHKTKLTQGLEFSVAVNAGSLIYAGFRGPCSNIKCQGRLLETPGAFIRNFTVCKVIRY